MKRMIGLIVLVVSSISLVCCSDGYNKNDAINKGMTEATDSVEITQPQKTKFINVSKDEI